MAKSKKKFIQKNKQRLNARNKRNDVRFGPVSTINTAPVSIGNSVRGVQPTVTHSVDGCRVMGRDFAFEAKATVAAATGWSLIGGMPLTPSVLPTTSLRSYAQMYQFYAINSMTVHYITSSATSQTGDVMFYYETDRTSPMIDFTNNSLLPYVLSDGNTVIGPQWTNHTAVIKPPRKFKSTNYGTQNDLNEDAAGSIFLFSKTSSANSPGYILIDYDITFRNICVNPRAGILPIARGVWNYITLAGSGATTAGSTAVTFSVSGNNPDGTATAVPTGTQSGDIFKCVMLVTNSTVSGTNAAWSNVATNNLLDYAITGTDVPVTVDDGFTFYCVVSGSGVTTWQPYYTLESAKAGGGGFTYGVTATISFNVCCLVSWVGSVNNLLQSSY